jgi:hypothetical protein
MLKPLTPLLLAAALAGCSTIPLGPSVLVLPGTDKDFKQFHDDDQACRQHVQGQLAGAPNKPSSLEEGQQRYDIDYIQCMYGKGHRVPVPGGLSYDTRQDWHPPPPPNLPPPPPADPVAAEPGPKSP